jgi:hypothetical protein
MKRLKATAAVSVMGGILVHLAVFTVIRIEPPVQKDPFLDSSSVQYVGNLDRKAAPAILQQAALFDSAPLFMPTRWNPASEMADVASLREATEIFDRFSAQLRVPGFTPGFPGAGRKAGSGVSVDLPEGPAFVLSRYGRRQLPAPDAVSRGPSFKLNRVDDSTSGSVSGPPIPPSLQALAPPALWTPAQFYFQLSDGLPAGLPVLAQSSGFADWDRNLQAFISSLGFYRQLEDGYYHLLVYP